MLLVQKIILLIMLYYLPHLVANLAFWGLSKLNFPRTFYQQSHLDTMGTYNLADQFHKDIGGTDLKNKPC